MFSNSMNQYLDKYSRPLSQDLSLICQKMQREDPTAIHMLSGNLVSSLLRFLVRLSGAQLVVDIGTFVGFSALACAEAMTDSGHVITCEKIEKHYLVAKKNINLHPKKNQVTLLHKDALDCLSQIEQPIDLSFIDADKSSSILHYEALLAKTRKGGIIVIDDVLWKGGVLNETLCEKSSFMNQLNQHVAQDARVENMLIPLRNGINLIYKL